MDQQHAAARRAAGEPLDPGGGVGGRGAGREGQAHQPGRLVLRQPPLVQEQPGGPAPDDPGDRVPGRQLVQHGVPAVPEPFGAGRAGVQQPDRAVHGLHLAAQRLGPVRVEAGAGGREADADPLGESGGDLGERSRVRGAHVPVPQGAGQGGQRVREVADVRVDRGPVGEGPHHRGQGVGQAGQETALGEGGDAGERRRLPGQGLGLRRGGGEDRGAPHARLRDPDGQLRLPAQPPALPEGAGAAAPLDRLPPAHVEEAQPVQEAAAGGVGVLAQVEAEPAFRRLGLESQGPLGAGQVPLQRDGRGGVRHLAEALADDQPVLDEGERDVGPLAHDGPYGVGRLAQTGQRAAPEGGEGLREPDRLDDMGGGDGPVLGAEQPGDLGHPALDRPVGDVEEVPVPAGGVDPGAVTAVPGEAAVGPRHPGQLRLDLREPLEQGAVGGEGGPRGEGGHVPGPADHGDGVPELLAHRAQLNPHVRLAHRVPGPVAVAVRLAERAHGLRQRGERGERGPRVVLVARAGPTVPAGCPGRTGPVACPGAAVRPGRAARPGPAARGAVFDDVLPPALGVVVPGGLGKHPDRVHGGCDLVLCPLPRRLPLLGAGGLPRPGRGGLDRERVRGGQVDEADRDAVVEGPAEGHPLRRERGHRPEGGPARVVHGVREEGDRRAHRRIGGQRQQRVALGRSLDEDGGRAGGRERGEHRPRRSGPVVPHPQQPRPGGRRGGGGPCGRGGHRGPCGGGGPRGRGGRHADTSRQAR